MGETKFRHEIKHYINTADHLELQNRMKYIAKRDIYARDNGDYLVRSLYFDNFNDTALREKIEGVNKREKFRIRFYNYDANFIRLEKKSKINGMCTKVSTRITRDQSERLINGDYEFLRDSGDMLFLDLYSKIQYQVLRPKSIVDYQREAYVYPIGNVRVTIDYDIRTSININNFFDRQLLTVPVTNNIILEIKYDEFLPQIITDITQLNNRQRSAFSKYAVSRLI